MDSCLAHNSSWLTVWPESKGATKAIKRAFKVKNLANQLMTVAPKAAVHRPIDMLRRSTDASSKSAASMVPRACQRRSHVRSIVHFRMLWTRCGAQNKAVLRHKASPIMKAYPPANTVATDP